MKNKLRTNPHLYDSNTNGRFCYAWGNAGWSEDHYGTSVEAFNAAKVELIGRNREGKTTVFVGKQELASKDTAHLVDSSMSRLTAQLRIELKEFCIPFSRIEAEASRILQPAHGELIKLAALSTENQVIDVEKQIISLKPSDFGVQDTSCKGLAEQLKTEYKKYSPDWDKAFLLQRLVTREASKQIKKANLPLKIESLAIWQGFDRTRSRYHIVLNSTLEQGRFVRGVDDTLCKRAPEIKNDYPKGDEPPCLACLERLVKLVENN